MLPQAQHIIRNATIDFHYHGNTDGLVLQQEVKDWVEELVQRLESQFDAVGSGITLLSIDKMELEVDLSSTDWREEAMNQVLKQWEEKVTLLQRPQERDDNGSIDNERVGHLFLFYLQHGHLPWQASINDKRHWTALIEVWLQQATPIWGVKLAEAIRSSRVAKTRFIRTVPFHFALPLFSSAIKAIEKTVREDYALFFELAQKSDRGILEHIYLSFLHDVIEQEERSYLPLLLAEEKTLVAPFKKENFQSALFRQVQAEGLHNLSKALVKESSKDESAQASHQRKTKRTELEEGIYISNAGLVVVAAFVPALFKELKIAINGTIQLPEYAVCLLNYLATGKEEMQEFELVLPKLLCGVPLETVIDPSNFALSEMAKQEVENVLSSVIGHWAVLKNTSVQGLRESFLQREGKLSEKGNDWILQAEQKSYDMLLQQLPWNMSLVKFPWMSGLLRTEWIY